MLKKVFEKMFFKSYRLNEKNILSFLDINKDAKILDLGCNDGSWTIKLAEKIKTNNIYGIDIVDERLEMAKKNGVTTTKGDLNAKFPFEDNFFDVIHANQVIEHIAFLDNFISEIQRILKPGGYVIISTENASSWHNIFASVLGWQIFSLTNISSKKSGIGNPLAIHSGETMQLSSWTHKTIFNYRGLKDFFSTYDFTNPSIKGAGYYPLPSYFGKLDPRHSHFITLKAYK